MPRNPLAAIDAAVEQALNAPRTTWFERLPDDARETLLAAREKFHSGGYGTLRPHTLCRVLTEHAEKQGWKIAKIKGLSEWLAKTS